MIRHNSIWDQHLRLIERVSLLKEQHADGKWDSSLDSRSMFDRLGAHLGTECCLIEHNLDRIGT